MAMTATATPIPIANSEPMDRPVLLAVEFVAEAAEEMVNMTGEVTTRTEMERLSVQAEGDVEWRAEEMGKVTGEVVRGMYRMGNRMEE